MRRSWRRAPVRVGWRGGRPGLELRTDGRPVRRGPEPPRGAARARDARARAGRRLLRQLPQRAREGRRVLARAADAVQVGRSAEAWEKVVGEAAQPRDAAAGRSSSRQRHLRRRAAWLERELDRAAAARPDPGRPADLHRLNRGEYANAIRDLLAIEVDPAVLLPPDTQAHGFDTNADALSMEPALLDRYLTAAAKIARVAVGDPSMPPAVERYTAVKGNSNEQTWLWQTDRLGEDFPLGSRGGIAARHYFPWMASTTCGCGWPGPTPTSSAACRCRATSRSASTACASAASRSAAATSPRRARTRTSRCTCACR